MNREYQNEILLLHLVAQKSNSLFQFLNGLNYFRLHFCCKWTLEKSQKTKKSKNFTKQQEKPTLSNTDIMSVIIRAIKAKSVFFNLKFIIHSTFFIQLDDFKI